jgi:multisubunit Na+/H+ antiporter MnhB subunit
MTHNATCSGNTNQGQAMQYDQTWMGYGVIGGLQAGLISTAAAVLLFLVFHWLGRRNGWGYGPQIGWTFLLAMVLTASGDLWNLFYFNYGQVRSLQLGKVMLAAGHDPDSIGLRALCELLGIAVGIYVGWALCSGDWRRRFGGRS